MTIGTASTAMGPTSAMRVIGVDFSSSPSRRKRIVLASGECVGPTVRLVSLTSFDTLESFGVWLARPDAWVGGFDLPFGLPRELVQELGWPTDWRASVEYYAQLSRDDIRTQFAAFCDARPVGGKFAHRATDAPAGSSPSMKWVNPPVAFMLHAGVPLLLDANVFLPGLHTGDPSRVALEAYPGLLARELIGRRSYKSDSRAAQTRERLIARKDLITALELGRSRLGVRLRASAVLADLLASDPSGDSLDAVLCMVQAAWGAQRHAGGDALYGLPEGFDPLEGWIVTAGSA